jgi:ASC-1-like (ASCH) protein
MTSRTIYREHLSEPWFTLVSLGLKTYEGRLHKNRFREFMESDIIQWVNDDFGKERCCFTKITYVKVYGTFEEYLNDRGLENCLPGMPNLEHGLGVYFKYFTKEDEKKYGVVSFEIEKVNYCMTEVWNSCPGSRSYVKTIDEAYQLLNEFNKNYEMGFEIDITHNTFENEILRMLKGKFRDIEFDLEDLTSLGEYSFADVCKHSLRQYKTFQNIQTIRDKKKEEEEYTTYCSEMDKAEKEYLASGNNKLLGSGGRI